MNRRNPYELKAAWDQRFSTFGLKVKCVAASACGLPTEWGEVIVLERFGARNGMILLPDRTDIHPYSCAVEERGFGFSVVEPGDRLTEECLESLKEMLNDWGWTGPDSDRPSWLSKGDLEDVGSE